jgi:hypothetical protein
LVYWLLAIGYYPLATATDGKVFGAVVSHDRTVGFVTPDSPVSLDIGPMVCRQ